jgi:hypothetical protein
MKSTISNYMFELGNTRNASNTHTHDVSCHVMSDMSTLYVVAGPRNLTSISRQYSNKENEKERKETYEVKISAHFFFLISNKEFY